MLCNPSIPIELISVPSDQFHMVFNDIQFAVSSKAVGIIFGNDVLSKFLVLKYHELSTVMAFVIHLFLFDFFLP